MAGEAQGEIEVIPGLARRPESTRPHPDHERRHKLALAVIGACVAAAIVVSIASGATDDADDEWARAPDAVSGGVLGSPPPPQLLAAERFAAAPSAETARALFDAVGGIDGVTLGIAEGAFDVVTFDPTDPDRLLASRRSSYGATNNAGTNEEWFVTDDGVRQRPYDFVRNQDVVHFTDDGRVAVWSQESATLTFAPRTLSVSAAPEVNLSGPLHAARSVIIGDTLFALTGSDDYYSAQRTFRSLVAERDGVRTVLDSGEQWAWVDSPAPDVVVAYPATTAGTTSIWDPTTLEPLPDHILAGRRYARLVVSAGGGRAVAVTTSGPMEVIDLSSGTVSGRFGSVTIDGIAQPLSVSPDGATAVTVERDGTVTVWWVGDDTPIARIPAAAGPARVVPEHRAPLTSSAVAAGASRIAVQRWATPGTPTTWLIIEADPATWIDRACRTAARPLTDDERAAFGFDGSPAACARPSD